MSEIYSSKERAIIISIIFLVSLIGTCIYLFLRVDYKQVSFIIFILSLIYATFFISLDVIAMFDITFTGEEGFEKFTNFISKFYFVFGIVDKALGFILFNEVIYFLESGYHSVFKKLLDGIIRFLDEIKNKSTCAKILMFGVGVPLAGGLLALLIIYRKHFGLENPLDYIGVLLDCYALFEIYIGVGFFYVQIFVDFKRQRNGYLICRYYRYSITKIIIKAEKYINRIQKTYPILKEAIKKNEKTSSSDYINYLKDILNQVEEKMNAYELEKIDNNQNNDTMRNDNNMNNNDNKCVDFIKMNEENNIQTTEKEIQIKEKKKEEKKEEKNEEKKDEDLPTSIRKYKNSVRRINKLQKLYKEIEKEKNEDLIRLQNKKCSWYYIILFIAFGIAFITDFLIPFLNNNDDDKDYTKDDEDYEKEDSTLSLAVGVLLSFAIAVICSSYTIIIIYFTKRRRYITGDFLYDKQINDNLCLMKTVQLVCGYSFALIHCNFYFWRVIDTHGNYKPKFDEEIIVPDYKIKSGITIYMIVKLVIIIISIIASLKFSNLSFFKNDLGEYNLSSDGCAYDDENEFNRFIVEKWKITNILKKDK